MAKPHDVDETDDEPLDDDLVSALVLRPKPPYLEWIHTIAPDDAQAAGDRVVVLTPELLHAAERETWLGQHHGQVFAAQLAPWTEDDARWPRDRSLEAFLRWFDVEWAPHVDDLSDLVVLPEVTCGPISIVALRDEFAALAPGSGFFLDVATGEMVSFAPEEMDALAHDDPARAALDAEAFAEVRRAWDVESLVELPAPSDAVERLVMESFAESLRVPAVRNRLLNAIESKRPSRRFVEAVEASGLRRAWQAHRDQAVLDLLEEALDYYGVQVLGETGGREAGPRRPRR